VHDTTDAMPFSVRYFSSSELKNSQQSPEVCNIKSFMVMSRFGGRGCGFPVASKPSSNLQFGDLRPARFTDFRGGLTVSVTVSRQQFGRAEK
jgi:hypothetical protein